MATFVKATEIPLRGARTLSGEHYTSEAIYRAEVERIFGRRWLCAARSEEITGAGDYVLREIGPESLIITRGADGAPRAFYNVCRHRGTRMCEAGRGHFEGAITCPYHAWRYGLDGRLLAAPSTTDIEGFDRADYPLHQAAVAEWQGFIFLSLDPHPRPFADAFAPLAGKFDRFNLPRLRGVRRIDYEVKANWKLLFENYNECYHCSPVHPQLVKLTPAQSGENDLTEGPFLGGYMEIAKEGASLSESGRACGLPVGALSPDDMRRVYYYSIFPNMLLSLHADYVMVHTLWPNGPERTHVECSWLFHPDSATTPGMDPDDGVRFWDLTNRQDWHMCELSQLGVRSRVYTPGPFSPREGVSAAWDREYLKAMRER